jgi:hypothetical protein
MMFLQAVFQERKVLLELSPLLGEAWGKEWGMGKRIE